MQGGEGRDEACWPLGHAFPLLLGAPLNTGAMGVVAARDAPTEMSCRYSKRKALA